ncbi:glycosyltransferase [bacterium]|nr:glycosyltransferase [bacterium]
MTTIDQPLVSVIMTVRNGELYIGEAVSSILQQTYRNFELIVIDDGSSDRSLEVVQAYRDTRIRTIELGRNLGRTPALNIGLKAATGEYAAIQDADDISLPNRFTKQVAFLAANPEIGVCGAWLKTFGESAQVIRYSTDHEAIKRSLLFGTGIGHSSALIRKSFLDAHHLSYDESYQYCQDTELWSRAASLFRLANLPETLVLYRIHPQQIGQAYSKQLRKTESKRIWRRLSSELGIKASEQHIELHDQIYRSELSNSREFVCRSEAWFRKLIAANRGCNYYYAEPEFSRYLADRWYAICDQARNLGGWLALKFWFSPLSEKSSLTKLERKHFANYCADKNRILLKPFRLLVSCS